MKTLITFLLLLLLTSVEAASSDETEVLVTFNSLTPEAALKASLAALESCRMAGYQVSVAVVDNGGNTQVILRDRLAGISSPDAALLKARTSINFRASTSALAESVSSNQDAGGIRYLPGVLVLGGGVVIQAAGSMVGAIGIAGAPDGKLDEKCATAGIEAIQESLDF